MGRSRTPPWVIDREVGDLHRDTLCERKLLTYSRYNLILDVNWLRCYADYKVRDDELATLAAMDKPENISRLEELATSHRQEVCK